MKRFASILAGLVLALAASMTAQAVISAPVKIGFVLPTTGCTNINGAPVVPCDNVPLTGANALTNVDIYLSLTAIPDNFSGPPTLSIVAGVTTVSTNFNASNGDTIFVRLKARTASAASVNFSNQPSKTVVVGGAVPGDVTSVTIQINIT